MLEVEGMGLAITLLFSTFLQQALSSFFERGLIVRKRTYDLFYEAIADCKCFSSVEVEYNFPRL